MALEIERKFLMDKDDALSYLKDIEMLGVEITKKRIEQNYLFEENSTVSYDQERHLWTVTLKVNHRGIVLLIPARKKEKEKIKEALAGIEHKNLSAADDCAIRIRLLNGEPIFTFKRAIENSIAVHEFEYAVSEHQSHCVNDCIIFCRVDVFDVNKDRYVFKHDNQKIEIDIFDRFDFSYLESEFKTVPKAMAFDFSSFPIKKEITGVPGCGNKDLSRRSS